MDDEPFDEDGRYAKFIGDCLEQGKDGPGLLIVRKLRQFLKTIRDADTAIAFSVNDSATTLITQFHGVEYYIEVHASGTPDSKKAEIIPTFKPR